MDLAALVLFASTLLVAAASPGPGIAALASEASGQRGNLFEVRAPDTRPEPGSSARAALASEASGQRGNLVEVRAPDTRPEPGSSARAALVARVIGRGPDGAPAFAAGLVLGDLVWLAVATLGLAVVAQTFHEIFLVIKYAGAAYLVYLAYRMWTAPVEARDIAADGRRESHLRLFVAGLALTLGNPKVVAFYLALLPNLIDLARVGVVGYVELASICVVVLTIVFGAYVVAAARARALFRSTRAMRLLNRAGGTMMAGAAVAVATK